jgi:hypothetical protein
LAEWLEVIEELGRKYFSKKCERVFRTLQQYSAARMKEAACRVHTSCTLNGMKNITLSADEALIEGARRRAEAENTTLNKPVS